MSIEYSPLCAYDLRAYLAYCSAKSPNVANLFGQIGVLADVDGDNSGSGIDTSTNVLLVSQKTIDVSYAELEESCRGCVECSRASAFVRATRIGGTIAWAGAVGGAFTLHGFCGRTHLVSRGLAAGVDADVTDIVDGRAVAVVGEQRVCGDNTSCFVRCPTFCRVGGNNSVANASERSGGVPGHCDSVADSGVRCDITVDTGSNVSAHISRDGLASCADSGSGRGAAVDGVCGKNAEEAVKYVLPQRRGPNGGVSVGRGKNYEKNSYSRVRRRLAKLAGLRGEDKDRGDCSSRVVGSTFAACTQEQRDSLQRTRAKRLVAENELKEAKAKRELELLLAQDVGQLKKRQETRLMRDTELNKVQVEQAFGKLAGTGNVPGFAQTVVSSEGTPQLVSGSISPNSSASMAEVHAMQKENLEYRRRMEVLMKESPDLYAKVLAAKLPSEETGWSIDENGWPKGHIGDGVGGMIGPDGRLHDYDDYADY